MSEFTQPLEVATYVTLADVADAQADTDDKNKRPSQSATLLAIAKEAHLFKTPDGDAFADLMVNGHRETHALRGSGFKEWLSRAFFVQEERPPSAQSLSDALGVLEGVARFEGPTRSIFVRMGHDGDRVYLDLGTEDWCAVEVSADGWRLVAESPIRFRRPKGLLPLPVPVAGGRLDELLSLLNIRPEDWPILAGWLTMVFHPKGPYPLLILRGEQGTGKTSAATMLKSLVDPGRAGLRAEPREIRDLMIAANNGRCLGFDNLSHIPVWLSDALCRLSTGGGFAIRAHYENADEVLFESTRPILINGIDDLATRSDLLDRCVIIETQPIGEEKRRTKAEIDAAFADMHPRLLGALLDAAAAGLKYQDRVNLARRPRMADFAVWATAAETTLGLEAGSFIQAYEGNRSGANASILDASAVGRGIERLMVREFGRWRGTASELYERLTAILDESGRRGLPKSPKGLSDAVRRLAPNLRAVGIQATQHRTGDKRTWLIEKTGESASPASHSSLNGANPGFSAVTHDDARVTQSDAGDAQEKAFVTPQTQTRSHSQVTSDTSDAKIPALSGDGGWRDDEL